MAAVYKVGKKWRADWTDKEGVRRRLRYKTKAEADEVLTEIKQQIKEGTYVSPKKIVTFGELADSWIDGRIELSRIPGEGYRPSTLAQWQSHIVHINSSFEKVKVNEIAGHGTMGTSKGTGRAEPFGKNSWQGTNHNEPNFQVWYPLSMRDPDGPYKAN